MPSKLDQAAHYCLDVEIFYEDLYYLAQSLPGGATSSNQLEAARMIGSMCAQRGISIVCLQPFMHYEGLRDRRRHAEKVEDFKFWIRLAQSLQTSIISVPSTFLSQDEVSGDINLIVQDMREVADLAASEEIQIAYESLAWGTHVDTWEQCWEVIERVDRANFGICLDTFNIAARVYADPAAPARRNPNPEEAMRASLKRLVETIDPKKIFYVQVVDAEYLEEPLIKGHKYYEASQHARMSWSRNCRLFYGEEERGAYLPIQAILKAILEDLGFEGWVSAELFNISLTSPDSSVPEQHASRAARSWQKILKDFRVNAGAEPVRSEAVKAIELEHTPRAQL